ncbi:MAG: hypothetical protein ACLQMS_03395 [Desulfomonilaceae bacterium]
MRCSGGVSVVDLPLGAAQDGINGKDLGRNAVRWGERRHVAMTVATTGINLEELAWIFFNIHISSGGNSPPTFLS